MDPLADYNASATLVIVAAGAASIIMAWWARLQILEQGIPCRDALNSGTVRILISGSIACFAFALGSLLWWPTFPMLIAGANEWTAWYTSLIGRSAGVSNWLMVLSLAILLWPAIRRWFGRWAWAVVLAAAIIVYALAYHATLMVAALF